MRSTSLALKPNHLLKWALGLLLFLTAFLTTIGLHQLTTAPAMAETAAVVSYAPTATIGLDRLTAQATQPTASSQPEYVAQAEEPTAAAAPDSGTLLFAGLFGLVSYIFIAVCIQSIAKKTNLENTWFAWVPILQLILLVQAAGKPAWWVILLFVPLVNIVIGLILLFTLPTKLGKPGLLGLVVLVPFIGVLLYYGILAFT